MLALKRFPGERINFYIKTAAGTIPIGSVMLVECNKHKATLGFDLPPNLIVMRDEIDEHKELVAK